MRLGLCGAGGSIPRWCPYTAVGWKPQFFTGRPLFTMWLPASPERVVQGPEKGQAGSHSALYGQVSEAAHCHFCFILLVTSKSLSLAHTREEGNWAPPLEGKNVRGSANVF